MVRTALRCAFAWVETSLTRVVIRDLDVPGKCSVTNTTRLFYFDSENDFAEIEYDSAGFIGFRHAVAP
jgi:hypothetical protein